jgi:type IV secretory pathway ATPase VirB11/archaellum biosynthesis ATPase
MVKLRIDLLRELMDYPVLESYRVGLFQIDIMKEEGRFLYNPKVRPELQNNFKLVERAVERLRSEEWVPTELPKKFGDLIRTIKLYVSLELKGVPFYEELAELAAYEYVGLGRLKPLLDDGMVDEVFQDRANFPLYLIHRRYGLCETPIILDEREFDALRVFMELFGGPAVTLGSPSTKTELMLDERILRVAIDCPPLSVFGPSLHIRKHGSNPFTLARLINMKSIGIPEAVFLLTALYFNRNVTILGPSGSGKTTLLNALDMSLPPIRRRIYVEDAVESLDLSRFGYHQLKLKVEPIESEERARSKHTEVLKSLHRSPDLFILGEIQDAEHSFALFQALASGVRGMQTFHSTDPEQAVRRWINVHRINPEQILDLDLLVTMSRPWPIKPFRYVRRISEIGEGGEVEDVFVRQGPSCESYQVLDLMDTKVFRSILKEHDRGEVECVMNAFESAILNSLKAESLSEYIGLFFRGFNKATRDEVVI